MATYISLVQFTDKGIHAAKETTQRVAEWAAKVQSKGVTLKHMYWTLGQYDQVCVRGTGRRDGRQRVAVRGHAGQHPDANAARFYQRRDGKDSRQHSLTAASRNVFAREQDDCFWAVMIGARAGRQWSFVGSLRDEARLYRGLSRASTTGR